ncbi:MAG: CPBP family glutamic-type intramembrane protease, partial [Blastocatellia bacterium]
MSITTTYCPSCGQSIEAEPGSFCARCQAQAPINVNFESPARAQLSYHAEIEKPGSAWLDLLWAFLIWGVSGAFLLGLDALLRLALYLLGKEIPKFEITRGAAIFTIAITLVLQLVALGASWMFVTRLGRKPFLKTLGWHWHPQFHWWQATVLALVMFGVAIVISKVLPHHETDMDKILKMGFVIRLMVATLAVLVAPLVEEVVYRGVVYSAVERLGGKVAGVIAVTGIFALVHVPQYWGSFAAITAILALSFVLTLVRSWTGSLLPCV